MNFKIYFTLLLITIGVLGFSQTHYNDLPIEHKIRIKNGESSYFTLEKLGQGPPPTILSSPEQDCNSAIPVCQNVYSTAVSYSGEGNTQEIPSNSCLGSNEKNSVWYTFSTSSAGNLAFNITPNNGSDDYDFALYDITGNNCSGISSGAITPIRCNFSATGGVTGLSASGTNASESASGSNQSSVLATGSGKTCVLIISNYSSSQSGYNLNFTPGTASIIDNTSPTPQSVTAQCGGSSIILNTSEQIKCSSIAANGSDFSIVGTGGPYTVSSAVGANCGTNSGQITINFSPALTGVGPWILDIHNGSDANSLIDACGNTMVATTFGFNTTPPLVTISGPTSVCKNVVFALTASSAASYTWSGASVPGGQQNQQTISLTPSSAGTMNFSVAASYGACGTSNANISVTVKEGPAAHFTIASQTICSGQTANFTNTAIVPNTCNGLGVTPCTASCGFLQPCQSTALTNFNLVHTWSFGDPLSGGSNFDIAVNSSHIYNSPGTYFVNLNTNFLIGGGCNTSETQTVLVLPSAGALTISPTQTICPSQSATLTVSGGSSYTWSPAGTLNAVNVATVVANPTITTTYSVSAPGCSGVQTETTQVVVNNIPPAIGPINGLSSVCANQTSVTYSVANVATTNYTWSVPAGASITSAPTNSNVITVDFGASAGTISVIAVSLCGTATASLSVTLNAAGSLTVSPSVTVCASQTVALSASGGTTYTWSPAGSLNTPNGSSVIATTASTQIYTVNSISCGSPVSGTVEVAISNLPPNIGTVTGSTSVCSNQIGITYSVNNVASTNYTWTVPLGVTITSVPTNSNSITVDFGTTSGSIDVTADNGCNTSTTSLVVNVFPIVPLAVTPNATVCPNQTITLVATGGGGGSSYTWTPAGNLNVSTGATVVATVTATQIYTVNSISCGATVSATVSVAAISSPPNIGVITGSTSVCNNQVGVTYSVNNVASTNYSWIVPPGAVITSAFTNSNSIVVNFGTTSGSVAVTATNSCGTSSYTQSIIVNSNPVISATPNSTICIGSSTTIIASGGATYTWTPNTNLNSISNPTVTASPTTTIIYTVNGTDGNGCVGSGTVSVNVSQLPSITASSSSSICPGATVTLTTNGGVSGSYTWSPAASLSASNTDAVVASPSITTNYLVNGVNQFGCMNSGTVSVVVYPTATITATGNATICPGNTTPLTANGGANYSWLPSGSLNISSGNFVTANPVTATIYTVTGTTSVGCVGTATVGVTIGGTLAISVSPNRTVCPNELTTLTASGAPNYTWSPNIYLNSNILNSVNCTPAASQVYTVTGANGPCVGTNTISVSVQNTLSIGATAGTKTICPIGSSVLTATGAANYVWNPSISLSSSNGSQVVATPNTNTTYTVTGTTGTCVKSNTVTVAVTTNPILAPVSTTVCDGSVGNLSVSGASTYTWSPAFGLNTTTGPNVTASVNSTQLYNIIGESSFGCLTQTTVIITIVPMPTITIVASKTTICEGASTTLTAFGADGFSGWTPAGSLAVVSNSVVVASPTIATNYTVTGTNSLGATNCFKTEEIQINVIPKITLTVSPSPSPFCNGGSATLFASAIGGGNYSWQPSVTCSTPNLSLTVATPTQSTDYTVTVTNGGVCPQTGTVSVTVIPLPVLNAGRDTTINVDEFVALHGTATNSANIVFGFLSSPDFSLTCNYCHEAIVNPTVSTCFVLEGYETTTIPNCKNSDTVCVTITKNWEVFFPNAFTPNSDGINDEFIPIGYAIADIKLEVYDRWGTQVFKSTETQKGWDGTIKGTMAEQGIYTFKAEVISLGGEKKKKIGHLTLISRVR